MRAMADRVAFGVSSTLLGFGVGGLVLGRFVGEAHLRGRGLRIRCGVVVLSSKARGFVVAVHTGMGPVGRDRAMGGTWCVVGPGVYS